MVAGQKRDKSRSNNIGEMKGIQRMASKLQRSSDTGIGSVKDMSQVDKTINRRIITRLASILEGLDVIGSRTKNLKSKESIGLLYLDMMGIFNDYQKADGTAYRSLLKEDTRIDSSDLNALLDLDADLFLGINTLALTISDQARTGSLSKSMRENIALGMREIKADVKKRIVLISKQRIHNKRQIN